MSRRVVIVHSVEWLLLLIVLEVVPARAQGTFSVHFATTYSVTPGGTIPVNVLLDPAPGAGLFSYGVRVDFDPARALVEALGIVVPKDLDFNGTMGPGAMTSVGEGFAAVKGTVDFSVIPLKPYSGSLLATFLVTDKSGVIGSSFKLDLSIYRTLGATETVFVDGNGNPLDDKLTFGSVDVVVVPEPAIPTLALAGSCCCLGCSAVRLRSNRREGKQNKRRGSLI